MRKQHSDAFRAKVALAAIKGDRTISEICSEFGVASSQVYQWKTTLLEGAQGVFSSSGSTRGAEKGEDIDKLYAQIGCLQVENTFLKKKCFN